MATPPTRDEIAGTPTNAEAKAGFGKLWDYVTGLLGTTGNVSEAKAALKISDNGIKNKLINAQGLINQRVYVSGTATTTANQYTLDRWRVVTSGQNLTFSTTANEVTFTAPAGGVEQVIEGLNLESGTYVLSWTGTATATVAGSSVANGGTVTVTGGTNTTVKFSSGTFKSPQFEKGSTATSFDYRPYGTELALCQRYYWRSSAGSFNAIGSGVCTSTTSARIYIKHPVSMRSSPVYSYSGAVYVMTASGGANEITAISATYAGFDSTRLDVTTTGQTLGAGTVLFVDNVTGIVSATSEL